MRNFFQILVFVTFTLMPAFAIANATFSEEIRTIGKVKIKFFRCECMGNNTDNVTVTLKNHEVTFVVETDIDGSISTATKTYSLDQTRLNRVLVYSGWWRRCS